MVSRNFGVTTCKKWSLVGTSQLKYNKGDFNLLSKLLQRFLKIKSGFVF